MSKRAEAREYVFVVRTSDPVRLRSFIRESGWQMPLAPFLAEGDDVALVRTIRVARRRQRLRARRGMRAAPLL